MSSDVLLTKHDDPVTIRIWGSETVGTARCRIRVYGGLKVFLRAINWGPYDPPTPCTADVRTVATVAFEDGLEIDGYFCSTVSRARASRWLPFEMVCSRERVGVECSLLYWPPHQVP